MSNSPQVVVVTPWYPTTDHPAAGGFVRDWTGSMRLPVDSVHTIHLDRVEPDAAEDVTHTADALGQVTRIPVRMPANAPRAAAARIYRDALADQGIDILQQADVVMAHVGFPSGWGTAELIPPGTRIILVEHASYLPTILANPECRPMYGDLLDRVDCALTPAELEARRLRLTFSASAPKIQSVGNPVHIESRPGRDHASPRLNHWLYLGNLIALKRVDLAIETFAVWSKSRPAEDTSFTIVGDGVDRDSLERLATDLGVREKVHFTGQIAPRDIARYVTAADLQVHLSRRETFGIAPIEGAAAGLAVLVADSGGPAETLSDAAAAGLVALVPTTASVSELIEATRGLELSAATANVPVVRERLDTAFGERHFGDRLRSTLDGQLPYPPPKGARVAVAALSSRGAAISARTAIARRRQGERVTVFGSHDIDTRGLDAGIAIVDLARARRWQPVRALEYGLVCAVPAFALRLASGCCGIVGRVPGRFGRLGRALVRKVGRLASRHRAAVNQLDDALYPRIHRPIDNRWLAFFASRALKNGPAGNFDRVIEIDDDWPALRPVLATREDS